MSVDVADMDLQLYLVESTELTEQAKHETFAITTLETAEWALRKLAHIQQQDNEDEAMAQKEMDRIQKWLDERKKGRQQSREFFEEHLYRFHQAQLSLDPKGNKSIKLPHGVLKSRKMPEKWEYNEEVIVAWAKEHGHTDMIRVKEEAAKDAVKRYVTESGEAVPGVSVMESGIKFSVEVNV